MTTFISNSFLENIPLKILALPQAVSDLEIAKSHFQTALIYYENGEFEKALEALEESYNYSQKPLLLYNMGLCYERLGGYQDAIEAFESYLEEMPNAPDKKEVKSKIRYLASVIEGEESSKSVPPSAALQIPSYQPQGTKGGQEDSYVPPTTTTPHNVGNGGGERVDVAKEVTRRNNFYRSMMWTSFGLSAAGLTTGLIGHVLAKNKEEEYESLVDDLMENGKVKNGSGDRLAFTSPQAEAANKGRLQNLKADVNNFGTMATVGLISGAALLGLGAASYWLDRRQARIALKHQTGGGSVSLTVRF